MRGRVEMQMQRLMLGERLEGAFVDPLYKACRPMEFSKAHVEASVLRSPILTRVKTALDCLLWSSCLRNAHLSIELHTKQMSLP